MAGLALAAAVICLTLPETHDQPMIEDLSQDSIDKNHKQSENLNANDVTAEENTLLWSNFFIYLRSAVRSRSENNIIFSLSTQKY